MKKSWPVFTCLFLILLSHRPVFAQVKINEFSSESGSDWVELYSSTDVDISGWILRDNATSRVETIPKGTKIGPATNQFFVIGAGNRLNKDEDFIKLYREDDSTSVDQISYGPSEDLCAPETGQTAGRQPDGSDKITRFATASEWQSNTAGEIPCPSPSPSPSPSTSLGVIDPSPSPSTSSESNQTTASPSPSTPLGTIGPSPQPSRAARVKDIILLELETPEPILGTQSGETRAKSRGKPDWQLVIMLILTGTGLLLATAFIMIKLWRKN